MLNRQPDEGSPEEQQPAVTDAAEQQPAEPEAAEGQTAELEPEEERPAATDREERPPATDLGERPPATDLGERPPATDREERPDVTSGEARPEAVTMPATEVVAAEPPRPRFFNITVNVGAPGWPMLFLLGVLALAALCYYAIAQNGSFPGADTIRSIAGTTGQVASVTLNHHDTRDERKAFPDPAQRHLALKEQMLDLTNRLRVAAGAPTVRLGVNPAAQLHAEAALDGCYASHWDRWGLKPQHRYSLSGGAGAGAENVTGLDYCIAFRDWRIPVLSMEEEVAGAVEEWMRSPDHRNILLNPAHTTLNVGIAHDRFNVNLVQHFGSDYVNYDRAPAIDAQGVLRFSGAVAGAFLSSGDTGAVQIAYDPPPGFLSTGQLAHTYALCNPLAVAHLADPQQAGTGNAPAVVYTDVSWQRCVDPYQTPADRPAPNSPAEANKALTASLAASDAAEPVQVQSLRIVAERLEIGGNRFSVQADLTPVLSERGPGIYTIRLWGQPHHMQDSVPLSEQSIFWQTAPPQGAPY